MKRPTDGSTEQQTGATFGDASARTDLPPTIEPGLPPRSYRPQQRLHRRHSRWHVWLIGGCLSLFVLIILACALLVGLFGGLYVRLHEQQTVSASSMQTLTVSGVPTISVSDDGGDVRVVAAQQGQAQGQVTVAVTRAARADSQNAAQQALKQMSVSITQDGATVTITAHDETPMSFGSHSINVIITTPATTNLNIQTYTGDIALDGVTGIVNAAVQAGDITAHSVAFMGVSLLRADTGKITLDGALQPQSSLALRIATGDATVTLPPATATRVDASTAVGRLAISGAAIAVLRSGPGASASGDTQPNPTSALVVHVDTGDINISFG